MMLMLMVVRRDELADEDPKRSGTRSLYTDGVLKGNPARGAEALHELQAKIGGVGRQRTSFGFGLRRFRLPLKKKKKKCEMADEVM